MILKTFCLLTDVVMQWVVIFSLTMKSVATPHTHARTHTNTHTHTHTHLCIIFPTVTDCPLDSSGGILWPRTGPGATRRRECSQVGVGIFQAGPVLRRQCSDLGSWTAADFTVCTVNTRTSDPVLLLWTVVEEITPERRATMFEEEQAVLF